LQCKVVTHTVSWTSHSGGGVGSWAVRQAFIHQDLKVQALSYVHRCHGTDAGSELEQVSCLLSCREGTSCPQQTSS
jgi:hypothetical protein